MLLQCPKCNGPLPSWFMRTSRVDSLCPACYVNLTVEVFPAIFAKAAAIETNRLAREESDASCYEHANKRAVSLCNQCGRFLCALCEVEIDGKTWCPACLHLENPQRRLAAVETQRTLYDSISLAIVTWPVLFFYPLFVAPPIAIYLAIKHWKTHSSIIPRTKWRFVVALLLAGGELCLVAFAIISIVVAFRSGLIGRPPH